MATPSAAPKLIRNVPQHLAPRVELTDAPLRPEQDQPLHSVSNLLRTGGWAPHALDLLALFWGEALFVAAVRSSANATDVASTSCQGSFTISGHTTNPKSTRSR